MAGASTKKHTNTHVHTHSHTNWPNQSVGQPLLGIIGEKEKDEEIDRAVATLK